MQIQPETIIWNQPSATSKPVAKREVFRFEPPKDDRINGSMPVWSKARTAEESITANLAQASQSSSAPKFATALAETTEAKEEDSFGFLDLVDMVNPLQHIPLVSTFYRELTGDTIKPVSRVVGGAAFGGPIGAASGVVNALVQMETGKDVGENMVASIEGDKISKTDTTIALSNLKTPQPHYNS